MGDTKFCLHWKDFDTNMTKALKDLREENDFFDVTIACEDNQIQAHKVILSACSTFFRNILRRHPHQHPLLYLKGVKYKQLLDILDFMYNGEVNVVQEELKQFLAVAADLRVQGLTHKTPMLAADPAVPSKKSPTNISPVPQKRDSSDPEPAKKRPRTAPMTPANAIQYQQPVNPEILEVAPAPPLHIESTKLQESPEVFVAPTTTPQKRTAGQQILEQCITEAEIDTTKEARTVFEDMNSALLPPQTKGLHLQSGALDGIVSLKNLPGVSVSKTNHEVESKEDLPKMHHKVEAKHETVFSNPKILQKMTTLSPNTKTPVKILPKPVNPKFIIEPGKTSTSSPLNIKTIQKFSNAWRCSICQRMSSTKKLALDHLKTAHSNSNNFL